MAEGYWHTEARFEGIRACLPCDTRGVPRVDDRRVISGIIHVLQAGYRWKDPPLSYGLNKTLYNHFVCWAVKGVWDRLFHHLAAAGGRPVALMIDATHIEAHRSAIGRLRGGRTTKTPATVDEYGRPRHLIIRAGHRCDASVAPELVGQMAPRLCLADEAYDSDAIHKELRLRDTTPVISNK